VLGGLISPPAAYALMVFVLLYTPCVATLAAVYKGSSSWKFTAWMVVYQLAVAWLLSFVVYRIGLLLF
ncbi:MAG: nucleoside recognition domain-containing protein, partial [Clostridiales bacterium]